MEMKNKHNTIVNQPDIDRAPGETCALDAIGQLVCNKQKLLQNLDAFEQFICDERKLLRNLDAIEQFACDRRKLLQDKEDFALQIKEGLEKNGRKWKPLYELFKPLGLLPTAARCNGEKRDAFYTLSKTAIGNIELYLPVMKRLAAASKKKAGGKCCFCQ